MKLALPFVAALLFTTPAFASDADGCDTSAQLDHHATRVIQMLEELRSGKSDTYLSIVPGDFPVEGLDFSTGDAALTARPLSRDDLKKLVLSDTYKVTKLDTLPPYICGSVVVKWTRPNEPEPSWMNSFTFRNGVLSKVTENDLVELKEHRPKVPPLVPPQPAIRVTRPRL
jgi:hypothetical protein